MSSRRTSSSSSRRSASSSRRAAPSSNNSTAILVGVGVVVLAIVGVMMFSKSDDSTNAGDKEPAAEKAAAKEPAKRASSPVPSGSAKAGKTPDRAAPELSQELLGQCHEKLEEAKEMYNDAQRASTAGDQSGFKEHGKKCQQAIRGIKDMLSDQLEWQEEAEMEGWAQPASYGALEKLWGSIASLDKKARMVGN